ncbi:uncharacterized protein KRP23_4601 [Phytophthora ramorum]|uniref:uncharacterized protein n=1 Tax=Phytophthora ramorum TaxID=164328 RepID=UPI0030A5C7BB|nr:hypothetical protein KRP23_4601 [Phytophthora ramorum]
MEQIQKEMKEVEARPSSAGGDMMQILVFMHEEADRRSETEDRRSREDRGARESNFLRLGEGSDFIALPPKASRSPIVWMTGQ